MEKKDKVEAIIEIIKNLQIVWEYTDEEMEEMLNTILARRMKNKQAKDIVNQKR